MRSWHSALRLCPDPDGLSPELITSSLISPLMPQPGAHAGLPWGELVHLATSFYGCSRFQPGFAGSALCFSPSLAMKCLGRKRESFMLNHPHLSAQAAWQAFGWQPESQELPALLRSEKGLLGTALG